MKNFIITPANHRSYAIKAATAEMAYRLESHWYSTNTPISVTDTETGSTTTYKKQLDKNGNLLSIETV